MPEPQADPLADHRVPIWKRKRKDPPPSPEDGRGEKGFDLDWFLEHPGDYEPVE